MLPRDIEHLRAQGLTDAQIDAQARTRAHHDLPSQFRRPAGSSMDAPPQPTATTPLRRNLLDDVPDSLKRRRVLALDVLPHQEANDVMMTIGVQVALVGAARASELHWKDMDLATKEKTLKAMKSEWEKPF